MLLRSYGALHHDQARVVTRAVEPGNVTEVNYIEGGMSRRACPAFWRVSTAANQRAAMGDSRAGRLSFE